MRNITNMAEAYKQIREKLKPSDGAGAYVKDFRKSDAPQFKGKSDAKKMKMAIAAYLDAKDKNENISEDRKITISTKDKKIEKDIVFMVKKNNLGISLSKSSKGITADGNTKDLTKLVDGLFDKHMSKIINPNNPPFEIRMEKLDDKDTSVVKAVVAKLKKASGAHAGQAKDLQKAIDEEMDPRKHVAKSKRNPDKFCVFDKDGNEVKLFDTKADAEKYAIANHDKLMEDLKEAKFAVQLMGIPGAIYIDAESAGKVKQKIRKMLRKPDDLISVERVLPTDFKADLRQRIKGVPSDDTDMAQKEEIQEKVKKEMAKGFDEPEFSKTNRVINRIGLVAKNLQKKELGKHTDEGRKSKYDMDQDDEEGANKNIIMQLRKSVDLKGRFDVEFEDGKKVKVKDTIARAAVLKHAGMKRPAEKLAFQKKIEKSYRDLLNALKGR